MKDIDLNKLKDDFSGIFGMMAACTNARSGRLVMLEPQMLRLLDFVRQTPDLIDQLEAAQRERDNWRVSFDNERYRADKLLAELKRRDDAVSVAIMSVEKVSASMTRHTVEFTHAGCSLPAGEYQLYLTAPAASPVISFYRDGVEAAANYIDHRREAFDNEHGQLDPDTGSFEFGSLAAQEHSDTLAELAEGVRSLHPNATSTAVLPPEIVITAEVARVGGLILTGCEGEFMDDAARRVFNAMLAAATAAGGVDGDKS